MSISLLVCVLFTLGLSTMEVVTSGEKLWVDQDSKSMLDLHFIKDKFPLEARPSMLVITAKIDGANVLTQAALAETLGIFHEVEKLTVNGKNYSSLCQRNTLGECSRAGVPRFWNSSQRVFESSVRSDADVLSSVSASHFPDRHDPVRRPLVFGGINTLADGSIASAAAMLIKWTVDTSPDGLAWEDALIKHLFVAETSLPVRQYKHVTVYLNAHPSLDKELARNITGEIHLFMLAFVVMVLYCCTMFGKPFRIVDGRVALGYFEVLMVVFSIGAGYGLACLCGIEFTMLQQILPFILMGIGMDDAFVLINAFDRTDPTLEVSERVYLAVHRVGVSIMFTSVTDLLAFLMGTFSKMPALKYFCLYAACSIVFIFAMHITCFCAALALDGRRQAARYVDCCCCVSFKGPSPAIVDASSSNGPRQEVKESRAVHYFGIYGRCLVSNTAFKVLVLAIMTSVTALAVARMAWGIETGMDMIDLTPDQSYLREFILAERRHWGSDVNGRSLPVMLIFPGLDHSNVMVQSSMLTATHGLLNLTSINEDMGMRSWHIAFTSWTAQHYNAGSTLDGLLPRASFETGPCTGVPLGHNCGPFLTGSTYVSAVRRFLQDPLFRAFKDDVVFEGDSIAASRIIVRHHDMAKSKERVDALNQIEDYNEGMQGNLPGSFASCRSYPLYDQYRMVQGEMTMTFGLCLLAVLFVSSFVLIYPLALGVLTSSLLMVFCDLMGSLYVWGLSLDGITMICLIMSIGLVVDYNSHMVHSFSLQDASFSRNERAVLALQEMGPSVLLGASSTFLGIMPLAFATSHSFRVFFDMFVGIVVIGVSHGLIYVPVVLSMIGPDAATEEHRSAKNHPVRVVPAERAGAELSQG